MHVPSSLERICFRYKILIRIADQSPHLCISKQNFRLDNGIRIVTKQFMFDNSIIGIRKLILKAIMSPDPKDILQAQIMLPDDSINGSLILGLKPSRPNKDHNPARPIALHRPLRNPAIPNNPPIGPLERRPAILLELVIPAGGVGAGMPRLGGQGVLEELGGGGEGGVEQQAEVLGGVEGVAVLQAFEVLQQGGVGRGVEGPVRDRFGQGC